jgi:NADH-quinone oxidoreductase subunit C/D
VNLEELREHICELHPDLCPLFSIEYGDGTVQVEAGKFHSAAADLKGLGFDLLGMLTAVDEGETFTLVYRLQSRSLGAAIFVKTQVPRTEPEIESLCDVWPAANWQEREVFDLFGIHFRGHPDLRRIFLPDEWEGHPLRKDYEDATMIRRPDYI